MRLIDADALLEDVRNNYEGVEYWRIIERITNAPTVQQSEPFGYFKAEPFGWTDCAETDEGAIALYEAPTVQREEHDNLAGWVSVEDSLPDISDEYYLFGGYTYSKKWESNIKHWSTHENANKRMLKDNGYSHWQNLPAAPTDTE